MGVGTSAPTSILHLKQQGNGYQNGLKLERSGNSNWWSIQNNHLDDLVFDFNNTSTRAWIKDEDASYNKASDRSLKMDIQDISAVLNKVMQLKPVTFKFKSTPDAEDSFGFIAQDVQKLYPEFVSENNGTLGLGYSNFAVLSIKAIQEQQEIIDSQQEIINDLEKRIRNMEEMIEKIVGN